MSIDLKTMKQQFENDLTPWKPIPFWSWNDKLEPAELCKQIDWMKQNEIGGFFMHARGGLKTEYLSEEWMQCILACANHAQTLGMDAWAYDENGWPSGFVGGKLLEDANNCDKYILHHIGEFDANATVSYLLKENSLQRVTSATEQGEYLNLYIHTSVSTADILNPDVVDKFINLTHEAYKQYVGEDFSKKIKGFFTDEPQYYRANTAFTTMLYDYFSKHYNIDILDELGLLFVEKNGYRQFRYRYWKAMQHLMIEAFAKKIYAWCEENQVSFTGHYIEENSLDGQMLCCGGIMPFYKYMTMPGIDWLCTPANNQIPVRQLASVSAQYGKKQTITETFGCCGWDVSPHDVKRIADFQFVNGVTTLCHHLIPYAEYGQRKKDYPAHYSNVNPWIEHEFANFNRYFTRLGYLLSESNEAINVAVLHPIRSAYFDYKREQEGSVATLDKQFLSDCRTLSKLGISYHFLDETLLAEDGFVKDGKIGCGCCTYDYLVLPHVSTMDASTEQFLREYVTTGGKLLILGDIPTFCEGEPFDYSYLNSNCTLEELRMAQPFHIQNNDNELYYTYRKWNDTAFLFVQNASTSETYTQTFDFGEEIKSFKQLDLITLEETNVPLTISLKSGTSVLLFPNTAPVNKKEELPNYCFSLKDAEVSCTSNQFTIDMVRYSMDGKVYSKQYPCPGLFAKLLEERYEGDLYLKYEFDIHTLPSHMTLAAEDCNADEVWINGTNFSFDSRSEKEKQLQIADITKFVHLGINEYVVKLHWYQNEDVYYALFGENVTESLKNCLVYDSEVEAIYLSGDFGVYPKDNYVNSSKEGLVFGEDFYIDSLPKTVTEPVTEGFPFFAGTIKLKQTVTLDNPNVNLQLNGTWHIAYVRINGKDAGKLVYDNCLDISDYAVEGENTIELTLIISNRNLLGPHHLMGSGEAGGVGPWCFDFTGSWKDGQSDCYAKHYCFLKLGCK